MDRVFYYELRRQVVSKFFVGLLVVCLFFAWTTLKTSVIQGVANTAPFSAWSFGYYMARILPLLIIALLFSFWNIFSPAARRVEVLTGATPVNERIYHLLKCGAALLSWLIILMCIILMGLLFLTRIFGNAVSMGEVLLPCVVTSLPALLFFSGAALLAGRLKRWKSIVVIGAAVIASFSPVPEYAALFGTDFFSQYPLTLGVLDPAFSLPAMMVFGKTIFAAAGIVLSILSFFSKKNIS